MALGGVFAIHQGKIKAHVMPDFLERGMYATLLLRRFNARCNDTYCGYLAELKEGADVEQWLRFFTMGPELLCFSTLISGDPTSGRFSSGRCMSSPVAVIMWCGCRLHRSTDAFAHRAHSFLQFECGRIDAIA